MHGYAQGTGEEEIREVKGIISMSIFKRGKVYWYHFLFNGEHVQKTAKQANPRTTRQMGAAYRAALAKSEVG